MHVIDLSIIKTGILIHNGVDFADHAAGKQQDPAQPEAGQDEKQPQIEIGRLGKNLCCRPVLFGHENPSP
jgi:hypothetical protein